MKITDLLSQYSDVLNEIKLLNQQISKLQNRHEKIVSDTVTGCTPKRSDKHVIVISGVDMRPDKQLRRKYQRLEQRRRRLKWIEGEIEIFIDSVADSKIRQILSLRYIDGLPWAKVAQDVYGYANANTPQMALTRYLKAK